jgi:hypothetical protein
MKLLDEIKYISLSRLYHKIKYAKPKRAIKFFWQRMTRGWDDRETWSLDHSLAKIILPRLKRFKQITIAVPCDLKEQEWNDKLDKMIAAFEFAASEDRWMAKPEDYDKHNEGIKLFAEYYWALWW